MAGEIAYKVYDNHVTRTGGREIFHKLPGVHSHGWYHQWDAAGNDSITFVGTRIRLYAVRWDHHGIATVSIDGSDPVDVDLYSATTVASTAPIWDSGALVSDTHTVVWSWSGRKNAAAVTDTYTVVLDWFDILPPPNANPIATGDFGVMTGRTSAITGGYGAQVRYAADASNYLDFLVTSLASGPSTVAINAMLNGVETVGGDTTWAAPYLVTLPTGLGQAYIKVVVSEAGNYKMFEVWVAPSASPTAWVLYLSLPLFALMGTNGWSNPYSLGSGYAWTDVAAANAIIPSPPRTEWYAKNFETSLDGAYGRVTMLGTDGLPTTIYSNGADGNDSLVSLDTMEYFDPTSTLAQVNSCQFSIHTPFTKETPQTTIATFLATFAQDQPFEVERGWMTGTDTEAYDVVTMGRFFVTDATLDKNQWIVNVEAQDGMGLLLDARYLNSPYGIITGPYPDDEYVPLPQGDDYVPFTPDPGIPDEVDGMLIAVGEGATAIATSPDGIAWTAQTSPFTYAGGIARGGALWVAADGGTNSIATSLDGLTWTARTSPFTYGYCRGAAWNGSLWVAVGSGTGTSIATSPDGVTWTVRTSPFGTSGYGDGVAWNGSLWVVVGHGGGGSTTAIATSPDGITWTPQTSPWSYGYRVAWNGSLWVVIGGGTNSIVTSPDGITWTDQTSPFSSYGVAWNGSLWVIVGYGADGVATSPDGVAWTTQTSPFGADGYGYGVAWNGALWVAVGEGATAIATSPDGIAWTAQTSPFNSSYGVAYSVPS